MRLFLERAGTILATLALAALFVTAGAGCASRNPNTSAYQFPGEFPGELPGGSRPPTAPAAVQSPAGTNVLVPSGIMASSLLRVGDMINVSFSDVPAPGLVDIRARIPGDGMLTLHYNVRVMAAGRTIPDLEREIRGAYVPKMYRNLTAIVRAEERFFFVGGEVRVSNRYPLQGDMTVLRAIDSAGGFTEFANRKKIELRRQDGTVVMLSEKKIRDGQGQDLPVLANDRITVGKRWW